MHSLHIYIKKYYPFSVQLNNFYLISFWFIWLILLNMKLLFSYEIWLFLFNMIYLWFNNGISTPDFKYLCYHLLLPGDKNKFQITNRTLVTNSVFYNTYWEQFVLKVCKFILIFMIYKFIFYYLGRIVNLLINYWIPLKL